MFKCCIFTLLRVENVRFSKYQLSKTFKIKSLANQFLPFEPNWVHLSQFEPIWAHLNPFGPIWTHLNPFEPIWTHLNPSEPIWSHLIPFKPIWNYLNPFGPIWAHLNPFDPLWTHSSQTLYSQFSWRLFRFHCTCIFGVEFSCHFFGV